MSLGQAANQYSNYRLNYIFTNTPDSLYNYFINLRQLTY